MKKNNVHPIVEILVKYLVFIMIWITITSAIETWFNSTHQSVYFASTSIIILFIELIYYYRQGEKK